MLHHNLARQQFEVHPTECLSLCPRPCGIALSSVGKWTYLFGDQKPRDSARSIIELASLYLSSESGLMHREQRPNALRASVLGRVPPFTGETDDFHQQLGNVK